MPSELIDQVTDNEGLWYVLRCSCDRLWCDSYNAFEWHCCGCCAIGMNEHAVYCDDLHETAKALLARTLNAQLDDTPDAF